MESVKIRMPWVRCVAFADREGFPYGIKSEIQIRSILVNRIERLIGVCDPAAIVIACNTASQAALHTVRDRFPDIDIIGTVPAIKPAAKRSTREVLAVLATEGTLSNPYLDKLVEQFAPECTVIRMPATSLVDFVEHRLLTATRQERETAIAPYIENLVKRGADAIILGCTHFLHLSKEAETVAARIGVNVSILDSREGVSRRLESLLISAGAICKSKNASECSVETGCLRPIDSAVGNRAGDIGHLGRNEHEKAVWRDRFYLSGNNLPEENYKLWAAAFGLEGPILLGE